MACVLHHLICRCMSHRLEYSMGKNSKKKKREARREKRNVTTSTDSFVSRVLGSRARYRPSTSCINVYFFLPLTLSLSIRHLCKWQPSLISIMSINPFSEDGRASGEPSEHVLFFFFHVSFSDYIFSIVLCISFSFLRAPEYFPFECQSEFRSNILKNWDIKKTWRAIQISEMFFKKSQTFKKTDSIVIKKKKIRCKFFDVFDPQASRFLSHVLSLHQNVRAEKEREREKRQESKNSHEAPARRRRVRRRGSAMYRPFQNPSITFNNLSPIPKSLLPLALASAAVSAACTCSIYEIKQNTEKNRSETKFLSSRALLRKKEIKKRGISRPRSDTLRIQPVIWLCNPKLRKFQVSHFYIHA